ncbi:MAG: cytochrome B6, partial [Acidobacteria bacterium]
MPRRRFWSVFPASTREATDAIVANLLLHWFPARMRVASLAWTPSLWLGTISWVLFLLLLLSGLPLMVFYIPSTREAYQSIKDIEHVVSFGWWLRAAHRIAAHLMVMVVTLHLARVFLTGSYRNRDDEGTGQQHREWNWVIGVALLLGTLLLSFTGYLLPWDQLAYWAVTVSMNIVGSAPLVGATVREWLIGGRDIGQAALMRFYLLHIVVLPLAVAVLFGYHMWRVRQDGGLAHGDGSDERAEVPAIPPVVRRIAVVTVATVLA